MSKQTASNVRSPRGREATLEDEAERHRAEVRVNLEQSRATFHSLLGSLKEADLPVRRPGSAWSVREVATHVVTSIENNPVLIGALRRGHDHLNLPVWVAEPVKRIYTWPGGAGRHPGDPHTALRRRLCAGSRAGRRNPGR